MKGGETTERLRILCLKNHICGKKEISMVKTASWCVSWHGAIFLVLKHGLYKICTGILSLKRRFNAGRRKKLGAPAPKPRCTPEFFFEVANDRLTGIYRHNTLSV
ncbi:MAG: hypothetical protein J6X34_11065 [Clostridia bacterium]|nr:hypothetical protein [Clostridia bacterium]